MKTTLNLFILSCTLMSCVMQEFEEDSYRKRQITESNFEGWYQENEDGQSWQHVNSKGTFSGPYAEIVTNTGQPTKRLYKYFDLSRKVTVTFLASTSGDENIPTRSQVILKAYNKDGHQVDAVVFDHLGWNENNRELKGELKSGKGRIQKLSLEFITVSGTNHASIKPLTIEY